MILPLSLLLASGLGVVLAAPAPQVPEQGSACVNDRCFRAFANTRRPTRRAQASAYCSAYLATIVAPVTVTGTPPITQTFTNRNGFPSVLFDLPPNTFTFTARPQTFTVTAVASTYTASVAVPEVIETKVAIIREATEYGNS